MKSSKQQRKRTIADYRHLDGLVVDGTAVVHMIPPKNNCTVDEYCHTYVIHITTHFQNTSRIVLVSDVYLQSSLKEGVCTSRGVVPTQIIKGVLKSEMGERFSKIAPISSPFLHQLQHTPQPRRSFLGNNLLLHIMIRYLQILNHQKSLI